ncbi:hypothetical protein F53441_9918 [Fusarium austroafricanum]|uniref:Uncharacterized protein n=1 Tax=Fusarium austroafricanum TaxID=2364996 RepID=A0A8H4KAS5_9HYPO|nr:hypothetical protein F53441_9918 [Fusarium austroafricanum]
MKTVVKRLKRVLQTMATTLWGAGQTNALWKQIVKCTIACIASVITMTMPGVPAIMGSSTFLAPMTIVFAHPGQRFGTMAESCLMILLGSLLGLGWSLLGLFLSSLALENNEPAAYAIRAMVLIAAAMVHGYIRSSSPRLFLFVAFYLIACLIILLGGSDEVSSQLFAHVFYPIAVGCCISIVVNLSLFPEFSSNFLGSSVIDALCETMDTLTHATHWFITPGGDSQEEFGQIALTMTHTAKSLPDKPKRKKGRLRKWLDKFPNPFQPSQNRYQPSPDLPMLSSLLKKKETLRARLTRCKAAQREVNYEVSISALPPSSLEPLSTSYMSSLVQNTVTIIGACENKYLVLKNDDRHDDNLSKTHSSISENSGIERMNTFDDYLQRVEAAKPIRQIESSSAGLLESIVERLREPVQEFEGSLKEAVRLAIVCVAYCYDVSQLPSGSPAPKGIHLQELDFRVDVFTEAIANFDASCAKELRRSAMDESGYSIDFMPRMETFLVSSFVLGLRQSATHVLDMLKHVRKTVQQKQDRNDKAMIWVPTHGKIKQWLTTGGESDGAVLPEAGRKEARRGKTLPSHKANSQTQHVNKDPKITQPKAQDEEEGVRFAEPVFQTRRGVRVEEKEEKKGSKSKTSSRILKIRGSAADALEWLQKSDDLVYAWKLTLAIILLSWPAFVWNHWYSGIRGVWAPMQLFLVFEVAIGTSFHVFFVRLSGVVFGSVVGYLSLEIGRGSRIGMIVILVVGIVPSFYVQLGTRYVKAGMISTVTMVVVALAATNGTDPTYDYFYKRLCAFVVGGFVALLVELFVCPARARDRLCESLTASIKQIQNMQAAMAVGLDTPIRPDFQDPGLNKRFSHARNKARRALAAAEMFLPFCSTEPRLKGSFKPLEPIYKEILYVLHQIIDRMDNVVMLRREYGSYILEDFNPQVHVYRRNVAASIMLVLFSAGEALSLWEPLPQFIPSSRSAQLRLINHVREVVALRSGTQTPTGGPPSIFGKNGELAEPVAHMISQKRSLSWNASTSGMMEIIEYTEELVTLVKLLVGDNAFRSGLLEKPAYSNYRQRKNLTGIPLSRVPTVDCCTAGVPVEEVATNHTIFAPIESRATGLQRTQTIRRASHSRGQSHRRKEKEKETESEEDIPMSLQRVGTRMCENDAVVRRRTITQSHDDR